MSRGGGVATATGETTAYGARLLAMVRKATLGEYEIRGEIGRGGMAAVYLAYDLRLNRKVAVKVMLPELALHEGMEDRFRREARTAAKLDHHNIVVIYSVREAGDLLYFVMKYIDGASLEQLARKYAPLPIPIVQHILMQLAGALQYAHDEGVVHRDVKPANVLIDRRGTALVTDFGIAKATESPTLTRTGSVIGTPAYMSPEQCIGGEQTHSSDQYSLGVVAFELIAGTTPFTGPGVELQWAHVKNDPPQLLAARPDCPPALASAVMRMLAKDPAQRWPSLQDAVPSFAVGLIPGDDSPRAKLAEFVRIVAPVRNDGIDVTPASPIPRGREPAPSARFTSIGVLPAQAQLEVDEAIDLVVAFQPTPAPNVSTPAPVWTSSAPNIVSVSSSGRATGLAPGSAIITAQAGNLAASTNIAVRQVPVASIQIKPLAPPLEVGATSRMQCLIRDAKGRDLAGREVFWASSDPRVASVNAAGELTGNAVGKATVGATSESITATATVEVVPERVVEVLVTPATLTLQERSSGRLSVRANNGRGKAIVGRQATLHSADVNVAAIGPDGVVVAKVIGRTTISATLEGKTGTAEVVVRPADVATIAVTPQAPSVTAGDTVAFRAALRDAGGHELTGRTVAWKTSDAAVLKIDRAGVATATKAGMAEVTAQCDNATASVRVTVGPAPITSLEIVAPATSLRIGKRLRFRAKAQDRTGRELEPETIAWRSSHAGVASVATDGTVSAVGAGEVTIFAVAGEHEARATLTVAAGPPPRRIPIAVPIGGGVLVAVVAAVLLFARAGNDDGPGPQPDTLGKVAADPGQPPAPPPEPVSPPPQPEPQPTDSVSTPPVTPPRAPATVAVLRVTSRTPVVLERGEESRVTVRAAASDGSAMPGARVRWTVTDPAIASVSANGTVSGRAEGRTFVTATADDGSARVEVVVSRPAPASVAISPRTGSVRVGEQTSLTARVRARSGAALPDQPVWQSSNAGIAMVDNSGTVRGVRAGEVTVSAVAGGATDSIRVSVTPVVAVNPPAPVTERPTPPTPRPTTEERPPATTTSANVPSTAEVDAALRSAARAIGDAFARGQLGQLTPTAPLAKLVREDRPRATGAPTVQRRSVADGRAEGDVLLPLRWTNFAGGVKNASVILRITLESQGGTLRPTAARNLNDP